jgi:hypothetical protein
MVTDDITVREVRERVAKLPPSPFTAAYARAIVDFVRSGDMLSAEIALYAAERPAAVTVELAELVRRARFTRRGERLTADRVKRLAWPALRGETP